jgi:hypothetical protein
MNELPAFNGDVKLLHDDFLPEEVVGSTKTWSISVDGRGRCRNGYKGTEIPGNHILNNSWP